jgi:hypothetical protein
MKKLLYTLSLVSIYSLSFGQYISITNQASTYSEDFNTLSTTGTLQSTLPNGWWISEEPGNTTYRAGDGSANSGDTYSFGSGTASDRSLGSVASGSVSSNFGVRYINNSGSSFSSFNYDFFMEQWRSGGRTDLDTLYFHYSVNNSLDNAGVLKISTGTWTKLSSNDIVSKITSTTAGALDGNLPANRQYYHFTVTGVTVAVGDTLYLRWQDPNAAGSDDGLSIDDYNFSVATTLPVVLKSFTASKSSIGTLLKWSTASEVNNSNFEVQRSIDGKTFEAIASVKGAGNSSKVLNYSFEDIEKVSAKTVYYRLKQIDFDGKYTYSKTASVVNNDQKVSLGASLPNPFNEVLTVNINSGINTTAVVTVMDMIGKVHYSSTEQLTNSTNHITISTTNMPNGIYFVRVSANGETFTQKVIKK